MADQHAEVVRRWVDPRDFEAAIAQRDAARKEAEKYKRRWLRTEQKLAEVERLYVPQYPEHNDGHAFVPDDLGDHGWPSYTCAVCGKRKAEHNDGRDASQ